MWISKFRKNLCWFSCLVRRWHVEWNLDMEPMVHVLLNIGMVMFWLYKESYLTLFLHDRNWFCQSINMSHNNGFRPYYCHHIPGYAAAGFWRMPHFQKNWIHTPFALPKLQHNLPAYENFWKLFFMIPIARNLQDNWINICTNS